ncbi:MULTISPECIES: hypothetical protein [Nocardia]|uniref:Uncharacterized protein n=2 Tax=Nocardia TaxID=1817 RepID=A0A2T2ZCH7_9NOCA|nr:MULTISPECIES: hypothetical protein [Nocardia]MBF6447583.1 hypothetical protein [Nocardia elegans]PSR65477.1 hypothetical protein C8259_04970 [Nocardia nova]
MGFAAAEGVGDGDADDVEDQAGVGRGGDHGWVERESHIGNLVATPVALPHNRGVTLPGLDHGSPADPSQTNSGGNPTAVAPSLREFFAQP